MIGDGLVVRANRHGRVPLRESLSCACTSRRQADDGGVSWFDPVAEAVNDRAADLTDPDDAEPGPWRWAAGCHSSTLTRTPRPALPSGLPARVEVVGEVGDHVACVVFDAVDECGLASPQHGQPECVESGAVDHTALVA